MKARRAHQFGGPEQLRYEDAPDPQVQPGQVQIRVRAAGINPAALARLAGRLGTLPLPEAPQALADLVAGRVFGKFVLTPSRVESVVFSSHAALTLFLAAFPSNCAASFPNVRAALSISGEAAPAPAEVKNRSVPFSELRLILTGGGNTVKESALTAEDSYGLSFFPSRRGVSSGIADMARR